MKMYRNTTARPSDGRAVALAAVLVAAVLLPVPAVAIQTLEAADHAELEAAISATGVSRVALADDRIRRVIRSPGGFDVEHDAASGDLYLRPPDGPEADGGAALPVTLFLGTERGFTYRLTLTPDARPSAQVLIRNAVAAADPVTLTAAGAGRDARVAELVRLVRAAVRRESLPGYVVELGRAGRLTIRTWRGTRFVADILAVGPDADTAALAERFRARRRRGLGRLPQRSGDARAHRGRGEGAGPVGDRPMSAAGTDARAEAVDADAGGVRRRQLLIFSCLAAALLVALALWLGMGSGKTPPPVTGIDAELAGPDTAEEAWTRRSEARIGTIEARLREMETDARRLGAENERLREKLAVDAADARAVIDRQAAMVEDLERLVAEDLPRGRDSQGDTDVSGRGGRSGARSRRRVPAPGAAGPADRDL